MQGKAARVGKRIQVKAKCKGWERKGIGQNLKKTVLLCGVSETGSLTWGKILLSLRSEVFSRLYFVIFDVAVSRAHTHCYTSSCAGQEILLDYSCSKQTTNVGTEVSRYFKEAIGILDFSICLLFNRHCSGSLLESAHYSTSMFFLHAVTGITQ